MITTAEIDTDLQKEFSQAGNELDPEVKDILYSGKQMAIPAGTHLLHEYEHCQNFLWLQQGSIRVFKYSPGGREITLYRVERNELCVLSVQCLLWDRRFPAEAVADDDIVGIALGKTEFDDAVAHSSAFNRYLLKELSMRMGDVVQLISDVTFHRLELRLACLLGRLFERSQSNCLQITHAQLARELGTTREMVSRILKELEHKQCVSLARGEIRLLSSEALSWFGRT